MSGQFVAPLDRGCVTAAEDELGLEAIGDGNRCSGYFPALAGMIGIRSEQPACRALAEALPAISYAGLRYGFNRPGSASGGGAARRRSRGGRLA